jgi:hypothetical protein
MVSESLRVPAAPALGVQAVWAWPALADGPRVDASLGGGIRARRSLERFSRVADTTHGLLPLELSFGYAPKPRIALVLGGAMAAGAPLPLADRSLRLGACG